MSTYGKEVIRIVALDLPRCSKEYGVTCDAELGVTGTHKCFNTRASCQDLANFDPSITKTLQFAEAQDGLLQYGHVIPSIESFSTSAARINLGGMDRGASALGTREQVTIKLADHKHSDIGQDDYRLERPTGQAAVSAGEVHFEFIDESLGAVAQHGSELAPLAVTRAGDTATRFNSSGVLEIALANTLRWDYDPVTLRCRGVLLEPTATQLLPRSVFSGSTGNGVFPTGWANAGLSSTGMTTVAGPVLGFATNYIQIRRNAAGFQGPQVLSNPFGATGTAHTISVFIRVPSGVTPSGCLAYMPGAAPATSAYIASQSTLSAQEKDVWVRHSVTVTHTTNPTALGICSDGGAAGLGFDIVFPQVEEGTKPTSWIPSNGATVTRNQDDPVVSDISPFFNEDEGTVVAEFEHDIAATTGFPGVWTFDDGTGTDEIGQYISEGSNTTNFLVRHTGNVSHGNVALGAIAASMPVRTAVAWAANDFAGSKSGGAVVTDTIGDLPTNIARLRYGIYDSRLSGHLRRWTYYPRRLTNDQLVALSGSFAHPASIVPFTNSYDPTSRGTFWGKLLARHPYYTHYDLRVYEGYMGDALEDMRCRHYVVTNIQGPAGGQATIVAKDLLSRVDFKKAMVPKVSQGRLSVALAAGVTSLTLVPAGIGDSEYDAAGEVRIDDEIMTYTRAGDVLTVVRGQRNTENVDHEEDALVQKCFVVDAEAPHEVTHTLLTEYTTVPSACIPKTTQWDPAAEDITALFSACVSEPTPVEELLSEIEEQAGFTLVPDIEANEILLIPLRATSPAITVTDNEWIVGDDITLKKQDEKRASQIWVYYSQFKPTEKIDDKVNFSSVAVVADLDSETAYGSPAIREVFSRWIHSRSVALELGNRLLAIHKHPPREAVFPIHADRAGQLQPARLFNLEVAEAQNEIGEMEPIQMVPVVMRRGLSDVQITAQELVFHDDSDGIRRIYIEQSTFNVNLRELYDSTYASLSDTPPVFIIDDGVIVGSTSSGSYALRTGTWPGGYVPTLIINGRIQGKGGNGGRGGNIIIDSGNNVNVSELSGVNGENGGPALLAEDEIIIDNTNGEIWGGGAGAGGGAAVVWQTPDLRYGKTPGGGGGSGQGSVPGNGGAAGWWSDAYGGDAHTGPSATAGGNASTESPAGGGSGGSRSGQFGGAGGAGGEEASAGNSGTSGWPPVGTAGVTQGTPGSGGSAGAAVAGNSFITWTATGDRRGSIT